MLLSNNRFRTIFAGATAVVLLAASGIIGGWIGFSLASIVGSAAFTVWSRAASQALQRLAVVAFSFALAMMCVAYLSPRAHATSSPRPPCLNNLKQLSLALQNYHAMWKELPPLYTTDREANPLHSWRTLILPIIEQSQVYERCKLKEPWNSPHNRFLAEITLELFHCPS